MITTLLGFAIISMFVLGFLIGRTEGVNKAYDLQKEHFEEGYDAGHAIGWKSARELCETVAGEDWVGEYEEPQRAHDRRRARETQRWHHNEIIYRAKANRVKN